MTRFTLWVLLLTSTVSAQADFPLQHRDPFIVPPIPPTYSGICRNICPSGSNLIHVTLCHGAYFCEDPKQGYSSGDLELMCLDGKPGFTWHQARKGRWIKRVRTERDIYWQLNSSEACYDDFIYLHEYPSTSEEGHSQ